MAAITALDILVEASQLLGVLVVQLAEGDKVNRHAVLLHLLRKLDERLLVFWDRRAGEDYDALFLGLVLAVLECELCGTLVSIIWSSGRTGRTYTGDLNPRSQMTAPSNLALRSM